MGIIINSVKVSVYNQTNGLERISAIAEKMNENISLNLDKGSKACPMISECRDIVKGIEQGDMNEAISLGALLFIYTLTFDKSSKLNSYHFKTIVPHILPILYLSNIKLTNSNSR